MKHLRMFLPLANNEECTLEYEHGRELISETVSDDWGAPLSLVIEARTAGGKLVRITIPYDVDTPARAAVTDDEE
jgi:hypothetical protein